MTEQKLKASLDVAEIAVSCHFCQRRIRSVFVDKHGPVSDNWYALCGRCYDKAQGAITLVKRLRQITSEELEPCP